MRFFFLKKVTSGTPADLVLLTQITPLSYLEVLGFFFYHFYFNFQVGNSKGIFFHDMAHFVCVPTDILTQVLELTFAPRTFACIPHIDLLSG